MLLYWPLLILFEGSHLISETALDDPQDGYARSSRDVAPRAPASASVRARSREPSRRRLGHERLCRAFFASYDSRAVHTTHEDLENIGVTASPDRHATHLPA